LDVDGVIVDTRALMGEPRPWEIHEVETTRFPAPIPYFMPVLIQALHEMTKTSPWCFPGRNRMDPLDGKSISKQIGDRQFQFKQRKELKNRRNDNSLVLSGSEWTPHDLRRTGSTFMQSLGVQEHVRERCLNHIVGGKLGRVYGRYEFASEKRAAWKLLGEHLEAILR
jgi:integrase